MSLSLAEYPRSLPDSLRRHLATRSGQSTFLLPILRTVSPSKLSTSTWHRLYRVPSSRPAVALREAAVFSGWRGLLHGSDSEPIAFALQKESGNEPDPRFTLSEGDRVDAFVSAVGKAEREIAESDTSFELAVVEIRPLNLAALWLQASSASDDRMMVYGTGPALDGVQLLTFCDSETFLKAAEHMSARLIKQDFA